MHLQALQSLASKSVTEGTKHQQFKSENKRRDLFFPLVSQVQTMIPHIVPRLQQLGFKKKQ